MSDKMTHIESMIDDYVLNLLRPQERSYVEQHAAGCPRCMRLLAEERGRTRGLVTALRAISTPPPARLELLWPGVAAAAGLGGKAAVTGQRPVWRQGWRTAVAGIALVCALLLGILGGAGRLDGWLFYSDTPATASHTASPTASQTPTWTRSYGEQDSIAMAHPGLSGEESPATGTPAPSPVPQGPCPQPNPSAPPVAGR